LELILIDSTNKSQPLKILIIDDHPLFVDGIKHILAQLRDFVDFQVSFNFADALRLLDCYADFDLVLLDMGLPDIQGKEAIVSVRSSFPLLPLVILSANEDKDLVRMAITNGVQGYIPKSTQSEVMISALNLIISGGIYIPKLVFENTRTNTPYKSGLPQEKVIATPKADNDLGELLTERQQDILVCLSEGLSNKGIARKLKIADGTVRVHMSTIYRLLDVNNRTQAVVKASKMNALNREQG
jgi:DNA-binding NarL/FixJ family response regulator